VSGNKCSKCIKCGRRHAVTTICMRQKAYDEYHSKVVEACVDLMRGRITGEDGGADTDEDLRHFFGNACSYEEEFADGQTPKQVAEAQWEAIT